MPRTKEDSKRNEIFVKSNYNLSELEQGSEDCCTIRKYNFSASKQFKKILPLGISRSLVVKVHSRGGTDPD